MRGMGIADISFHYLFLSRITQLLSNHFQIVSAPLLKVKLMQRAIRLDEKANAKDITDK